MARRSVTFEVVEAHATGRFGDLTSSLLDLMNSQIAAIRVESNVGPVTIPEPFKRSSGSSTAVPVPTTPGVPGVSTLPGYSASKFSIERFLQPKYVIIDREGGETPIAPYGEPSGNYRPAIIVGGLFILGLAIYGGVKLVRR